MALAQRKRKASRRAKDPFQQLDREIKFLDKRERFLRQRDLLRKRMIEDFRRKFPKGKNPFDAVK